MKNILTKANYLGLSLVVLYTLSGEAECMQDYRDCLSSEPVASTLKRLHQKAEEADKPLMEPSAMQPQSQHKEAEEKDDKPVMGSSSTQSQLGSDFVTDFLIQEKSDLRGVYQNYSSNYLNISDDFGRILYSFVRSTKPELVVEFGTSMGISAIYLAAALRDNGSGKLITTELIETKALQAKKNLASAGLDDLVEIRIGNALETLKEIDGDIGFVHLDGAWGMYRDILDLLKHHLRPGTFVIGENALDPTYLDYVRNPKNGYHSQRIQIGEKKDKDNDFERGNELTVVL